MWLHTYKTFVNHAVSLHEHELTWINYCDKLWWCIVWRCGRYIVTNIYFNPTQIIYITKNKTWILVYALQLPRLIRYYWNSTNLCRVCRLHESRTDSDTSNRQDSWCSPRRSDIRCSHFPQPHIRWRPRTSPRLLGNHSHIHTASSCRLRCEDNHTPTSLRRPISI